MASQRDVYYSISLGTMMNSSNPPLPSLVHPTFPPSTTATIKDRSPCLSARKVLTCGGEALGFTQLLGRKKASILFPSGGDDVSFVGVGVPVPAGGFAAAPWAVPRGRTVGVGKAGRTGKISSICGRVGNGTDLALLRPA